MVQAVPVAPLCCCCLCNGNTIEELPADSLSLKEILGGRRSVPLLFPQLQPSAGTAIHIPLAWKMLWTPAEGEPVQDKPFLLSALMPALEISWDTGTV